MPHLIALGAALLLTGSAWASPYRLQLDNAPAYRLTTTAPATASQPYAAEIAAAAHKAGVDAALVHAVIAIESGYRADAVSPRGAIGLMQLMPATARRFGTDDPRDPQANLQAGTRYLRFLIDRFPARKDLAIAAYNAGEGAVSRHGGIPPYPETQAYVPAVLRHLATLQGQAGKAASRHKFTGQPAWQRHEPNGSAINHSGITVF
ncbi:MAG: transglycosylase [Betaproteobacteria bacterium HGW-Betaproteobacteria-7]|jgi:soluble lytic murein transglycosylase-like protein|nr:MAG: transglycosylase [Betaproteobacteria bacterium HGW-Betaproteobacteria-7]